MALSNHTLGDRHLIHGIRLQSRQSPQKLSLYRRLPSKGKVTESVLTHNSEISSASGNIEIVKPDILTEAQRAVEVTLEVKARLGHETSDLLSNNYHRMWVTAGAGAVLGMYAKSAMAVAYDGDLAATSVIAALAAYVLADFGTGVYHWGIDNYGDASTPIFGAQIDAFQGHHQRPWTITKREFANNLHALARPASLFLLPFLFLPNNAGFDSFLGTFLACVVMSQQFHAWSHTRKDRLPPAVRWLQDAGFLVGRKMHGSHHRPPYNTNYCIVSGLCNRALDSSRLFPWLEATVFRIWGVAPRSWGETAPEWLEVEYYEDLGNITDDLLP